ncbi:MAG: hypothetical protein ABI680_04600, partial [Chthoniobacteraceae bacterium]
MKSPLHFLAVTSLASTLIFAQGAGEPGGPDHPLKFTRPGPPPALPTPIPPSPPASPAPPADP